MKRNLAVCIVVMLVLCLSSCKKEPGPNEVYMRGSKFNPSTITVTVGTTVTWTNNERGSNAPVHTVTSDSAFFDSGDLFKGKTFQYTFSTKGEFSYHCKHHAGMTGRVIVQ